MSKKKKPAARQSTNRRIAFLDENATPSAVLEALGDSAKAEFYQSYDELMKTSLKERGQEARHFYELLNEVDAATDVEDAIRSAGFVLGFEFCRRLLVTDALRGDEKGGAR